MTLVNALNLFFFLTAYGGEIFVRKGSKTWRICRGRKKMMKLQWLESFSIGIKSIDDDHKNILQAMQNVQVAVENQDYSLCSSLLDELVDLAMAHFEREEEYLAHVSYPYIEEHILYHQELLLKIKAVRTICNNANSQGGLEECFYSMAEFLIDDIIEGDLQFKSYLQSRGLVQ